MIAISGVVLNLYMLAALSLLLHTARKQPIVLKRWARAILAIMVLIPWAYTIAGIVVLLAIAVITLWIFVVSVLSGTPIQRL